MSDELLKSGCAKNPAADVFSLGQSFNDLAASPVWNLPCEGDRWHHEIRRGVHGHPDLPTSRSESLVKLTKSR